MPFLAPWFALAGAIAAVGVLVIHLLNRQRYKVVEWAAMDFLREAIFRNRRLLRLRDLLLLLLRMAAIALFGMALARPFLGRSPQQIDPNQPVHAVLLIDNSLSMGYEELGATLLGQAKTRAGELIDKLPRTSRISVVPTCGLPTGYSREAYYSKDDAKEAVGRIEPVDRAAQARETLDLALEARRRVDELPARIYLLTDRQVAAWPIEALGEHLDQFRDTPIEFIELAPQEVENAWIVDFQLRDGVADLQTPAVFVATLEYEGTYPRHDVLVTLTIDGVKVAAKTVELLPGQQREVEFPPYQIDVPVEPGRPAFVTAEVSIPQDRLAADDQRFLVAAVVATLPVVFVDQWGAEDEDPQRNRYGETYHLRRLLAPTAGRSQRERQPIEVRHVTIDQLEGVTGRELLGDARLVVIAGVAAPQRSVPLLVQYVEQGGNLVIAAGGQFNPGAWAAEAFSDGLGILPAPLEETTVGALPEEAVGQVQPFQLAYSSMQNHPYFLLEGVARQEQEDLYSLPYFFKAVVAHADDDVKDAMAAAMAEQFKQRGEALAEIDGQLRRLDDLQRRRRLSVEEQGRRTTLRQERERLEPSWLAWEPPNPAEDAGLSIEELAERTKPVVLARYTNGLPFMIERRLGRGRVLLVTTGVYSTWNTLPLTNTVLLYDRILRGMLRNTLPERNLTSERGQVLPLPAAQRNAQFTLTSPDQRELPVPVEAVGADRWGITLGELTRRGHYYVTARRTKDSPQRQDAPHESLEAKLWVVPLAINGPAGESRLLTAQEAQQRRDRGQRDWQEAVEASAMAALQPAGLRGAGLWRWFLAAVLALLLLEMTLLSRPAWGGEQNA